MGLFSSLFGNGGSDKADKLRQQALDAFNQVKTPDLQALQVQLQGYVNAGKITPQQAESTLLSSNAFNNLATDPSLKGAQKQALTRLMSLGTSGGVDAITKSRLQDITDTQNQENQSQNAAIMRGAQARGTGGSDLTTVNQLIGQQGAADRAARSGTSTAADAESRALAALSSGSSTAAGLEGQEYGEAANKAQAQNAIDLFNAQTAGKTNLYNTQTANEAQAANLANEQALLNANTATSNANKEYNASQNQTVFNDELQKATGKAKVLGGWADTADEVAKRDQAANAGLTAGLVQAGGKALAGAFSGPAAAASAAPTDSMTANGGTPNRNINESDLPGYAHGGKIEHPDHPLHLAAGGHMDCYAKGGDVQHHADCYMSQGGKTPHFLEGLKKGALHKQLHISQDESIPAGKLEKATHSDNETLRKRAQFAENAKHWHHAKEGGKVPGHAKVEGDSPKNDTVDAKLSPGEIVVPRSAANDEEEFKAFMAKFEPTKKYTKGGIVIPRVNNTNPMRNVAKAPLANPVPLAATNDAPKLQHFMTELKPPVTKPIPEHKIPLEARALANLHKRLTNLGG